jgi:hypothetical protein
LDAIVIVGAAITLLLVFDLLAVAFGSDSRDDFGG